MYKLFIMGVTLFNGHYWSTGYHLGIWFVPRYIWLCCVFLGITGCLSTAGYNWVSVLLCIKLGITGYLVILSITGCPLFSCLFWVYLGIKWLSYLYCVKVVELVFSSGQFIIHRLQLNTLGFPEGTVSVVQC